MVSKVLSILQVTFLCVSFTVNIVAQSSTFEIIHYSDNDEHVTFLADNPTDNNFFVLTTSQPLQSSHMKSKLLKFDRYGNFLESKTFVDSLQTLNLRSIDILSADSILVCGIKYDSSSDYKEQINSSLVYYILNHDLEVLDSNSFLLPPTYAFGQCRFKRDSLKYFFYGGLLDSIGIYTIKPFLYEFSSSFDSICFNFWPDSTGAIQDIRIIEPNKYWSLIHGFKSYTAHYYFFDSSYNVLHSEYVPYYLSDPFGVKWNSDTTFYLVGEWNGGPDDDIGFAFQLYDEPNNYQNNIFNSWGTEDTLDLPAFYGGLDFNDNDSIFIGAVSLWFSSFLEYENYLVVLQTDSMLNIRWERFYGGDAYYAPSKLIATPDGGCLFAGTIYDFRNSSVEKRNVYVLKVNNEGLIVGKNETPAIEMHEAIVYPNPGTTEVRVRIAAQYKESLFQLFDMNGKQVASEKIVGKWGTINTSFLKPGTYIYRISSEDGLFESGKWVRK